MIRFGTWLVAALSMAAARFMPGVCAVLTSSSLEWTTRTPAYFHFEADVSLMAGFHFRIMA